ncbi:MAG: hypothetical protein Q8M29_04355 [Bacteroidota bacterium]|nr:hypothetical protein [Bacteroidota bacterium]
MEVVYKVFIDNKCAGSIYGPHYYSDKRASFDQGFTQFETLSKEIKKSTGNVTILRMGDEHVEAVASYEDFKKWVGENYKSYVGACK